MDPIVSSVQELSGISGMVACTAIEQPGVATAALRGGAWAALQTCPGPAADFMRRSRSSCHLQGFK